MLRGIIFYSCLLLFILFSFTAKAGNETVIQSIRGSEITAGNDKIIVSDDKYPNQNANAYVKSSVSVITLGFDHESILAFPTGVHKVPLEISYIDVNNISHTITHTLSINMASKTDKDKLVIENASHVRVNILSPGPTTDNVASVFGDKIYLSAEIQVERYYAFDETLIPTLHSVPPSPSDVTEELELTWKYIVGAEEFELEYTYVDDYASTGLLNTISAANLKYDFRFNSTRVITNQQSYKIPVVYDRGYLLYRVRAVGRGGMMYQSKVYGRWSSHLHGATVATFPDHYPITDPKRTNWQFFANFAEEGKRKDVMSHFDGSLRNRQVLTRTNSNNKLIVGETFYDYQGRPAIQVLPVPLPEVDASNDPVDKSLNYHEGVNKNDELVPQPYSKKDFDNGNCEMVSPPMSDEFGASNYYSEKNLENTNENAYIPDAEEYPFTQVEYEPDNTGRIKKQSGVGDAHKLGSNHETKYFYGQPEQEELDRLLGNSAGYASHYKKNAVIDANGQISVSYLDQQGRVVATALTGSNLNTPSLLQLEKDGLPFDAQAISITQIEDCPLDFQECNKNNRIIENGIIFSKEILVTNPGVYTFNYDVTAAEMATFCGNACYECAYDLEIIITDHCGDLAKNESGTGPMIPVKDSIGVYGVSQCDGTGESFARNGTSPIRCSLSVGNYTVTKKLTINETKYNQYLQHHLNYCTTTLDNFDNDYINNTEILAACEEIDCKSCMDYLHYQKNPNLSDEDNYENNYDVYFASSTPVNKMTLDEYKSAVRNCEELCEPINNCEASYQMMLSDMSPGGQYAATSSESEHWALSILVDGNINLPRPRYFSYPATYRRPLGEGKNVLDEYRDDNGNIVYIPVLPIEDEPDFSNGMHFEPNAIDGSGVIVPLRLEGDHYVYDPNGEYYGVKPGNLRHLDDFISNWKPSWAKALVKYHPEYCYYESCSKNSDLVTINGGQYSSNDFDDRIMILETFSDASIVQVEDLPNSDPNPFYDPRFTTALMTADLSLTDLLNKDPYFFGTEKATLKAEMLSILTNYKLISSTPTNVYLNVKQFAAVTARCGTLYYADNDDLNSLGCKAFGTHTGLLSPEEVEILDHEWQIYNSIYLSEKQKIQRREADLYCLDREQTYVPGYNECIGDSKFNPWKKQQMWWKQGVWYNGLNDIHAIHDRLPCAWPAYSLYRNKVKRFTREEDITAPANVCETDPIEVAVQKMKEKAEMELYLETGQCPAAYALEGFLSELGRKNKLSPGTGLNLSKFGAFPKSIYDFLIFGTLKPTAAQMASHQGSGTGFTLILNSGTDDYKNYNFFPSTAQLNIQVVNGQNYLYREDFDDHDKEYVIPLNFLTNPSVHFTRFEGGVYAGYFPVGSGRFTTKIIGFRNLMFTTISGSPALYNFTMEASVEIIDNTKPIGYQVIARYHEMKFTGSTHIPIGNCSPDFSTVCELTDEYKDLEALLSAISAKDQLTTASPVLLTDESSDIYYHPYFTELIKSHITPAANYTFTSSISGNIITVNVFRQGESTSELTLTLTNNTSTPVTNYNNILYFTCVKDRNDELEVSDNDFFITAMYSPDPTNLDPAIGKKIEPLEFIGRITSVCSTCIPFKTLKCGPPAPEACRSQAHENKDHMQAFLEELITDNLSGSTGNSILQNGMSQSLLGNIGFRGLQPQLGAGEFFIKNISISNADGIVSNNGNNLSASICTLGQNGNCGCFLDENGDCELDADNQPLIKSCSITLRFVEQPANVTFSNIIGFAGLKADHTELTGGKAYGFKVFAICKVPGLNFPVNVEMKGTSCFPIASCEVGCFAGKENLVINGDFSDPSLIEDPDCVECDCSVIDNSWSPGIYQYDLPKLAAPAFQSDYCLLKEWNNQGWGAAVFTRKPQDSGLDWDGYDHTDGKGYFLYTDNRYQEDGANPISRVWYQTIAVEPGEVYEYSAWAMNLHQKDDPNDPYCNGCYVATTHCDNVSGKDGCPTVAQRDFCDPSPKPKDEFSVKLRITDLDGNVLHEQLSGLLTCTNGWQKVSTNWTNPSVQGYYKVIVSIINMAIYYYGGDAGFDDIAFQKLCKPQPPITPEVSESEISSCVQHLTDVATLNAHVDYDRYIQQQKEDFRKAYLNKCLKPIEHLNYTYQDREFHHTLYYYDQAGNLVKTVPPAGVDVLDQNETGKIKADRWADNFNLANQPEHTMATTYTYNSLNQLVTQSVPDNETMDVWESQPRNLPNVSYDIQSIQFTDGNNGFVIANDDAPNGFSHVYHTTDGGTTWDEVSEIGTSDIMDIQYPNANDPSIVYAIGDKGVFLKSNDAGLTWELKTVGSSLPLVEMEFTNASNGMVFASNGNSWVTSTEGDTWEAVIPTFNLTGTLKDVSINPSGVGYAVSSDGTRGYVYRTSNGGMTWSLPSVEIFNAEDLTAVQFVGSQKLYAAGKFGTWLTSDNDGATWKVVASNLNQEVKEIYFSSATTGFILTTSGDIFKSENSGETWVSSAPEPFDYTDIFFYDVNTGYAVTKEKKVFKYTTASNIWTEYSTASPEELTGISFYGQNIGLVAGKNGVIYRSGNGGSSWGTVSQSYKGNLPAGDILAIHYRNTTDACVLLSTGAVYYTTNINTATPSATVWNTPLSGTTNFVSMQFTSGPVGYARAASNGDLYSTPDGGKNWSLLRVAPPGTTNAIWVATSTRQFAVGNDGKISRIVNGSAPWLDASNIIPLPINGAYAADATEAYIAGDHGDVYRRISGVWKAQDSPTKTNMLDVDGNSATSVAAIGENGKSIYTVNGTSWTAIDADVSTTTLRSLDFGDASKVATVGNRSNDNSGAIRTSSNGGSTWSSPTFSTQSTLNTTAFSDSQNGLIGGSGGLLIKTVDGGSVWTSLTKINPLKLNASHLVPGTPYGYAVGANGAVVKTTDGGLKWSAINSPVITELTGVYFFPPTSGTGEPTIGIIIGTAGKVYRTIDGGATWTNISLSSALSFTDITFYEGKGIITSLSGAVYYSTDSGMTWLPATGSGSQSLFGVFMVSSKVAFAVGNAGTIIKSNDGGATWTPVQKAPSVNWTSESLHDVYFTDVYTGYAIGENGTLLKSINKGVTWTAQTSGAGTADLRTLTFTPSGYGYYGGLDNSITRLNDQRDKFSSRFWYDELGRLIASQNSKQFNFTPAKGYSYTRYDALGRIIEVGEILHSQDLGTIVTGTEINSASFEAWLAAGNDGKRQITKSYYDKPVVQIEDFTQENLRKRIATITFQENAGDCYDQATHYTYDIHGNVKTLFQENNQIWTVDGSNPPCQIADVLAGEPVTAYSATDPRLKRIDYTYDLISGNVKEVNYQDGEQDQFSHRYSYDADNRIMEVQTSTDGLTWEKDGKYFYYNHGPLARTEIGEHNIQGMDFAYTIQGWIKGVNSNTLLASRDIGKDGKEPFSGGSTNGTYDNRHRNFLKDEFGYTLNYFEGDYQSITPLTANELRFEASITGSKYQEAAMDLYNGNISGMVTAIGKLMSDNNNPLNNSGPMGMAYRYDQLNRLKSVRMFKDANLVHADQSGNIWGSGVAMQEYSEDFTYDANGNILYSKRNGYEELGVVDATEPTGDGLDNLEYIYETIERGYEKNTNKLRQVIDHEDTDLGSDLKPGQLFNNYVYDEIGNLVKDNQENIKSIEWTVYGKVKKVIRYDSLEIGYVPGQGGLSDLEFFYDATGNRIMKLHMPRANGLALPQSEWVTTYYVRDASGNVMSIYEEKAGEVKLSELPIYGSDRLGTLNPNKPMYPVSAQPVATVGNKHYELKDHLGNVKVVLSNQKFGLDTDLDGDIDLYTTDVKNAQNYYAFGMQLPGRTFTSSLGYRYGFNGKEKDSEWGGGAMYDYGFRIYDPRIAKFLSVDPLSPKYPWYTPYQFAGNNPIKFIDLDGLEQATPDQKARASNLIDCFEINAISTQVFKNISKKQLVGDLRKILNEPGLLIMNDSETGYYCGLYAISYVTAYQDPEAYIKAVFDLYQSGKTVMNGKEIEASESLKNSSKNGVNPSVQIFGGAMRETDDSRYNENNKFWSSTSSETMKEWLEGPLNLNVSEFDYGYELAADGIALADMSVLKKHIDAGKLAVLMVNSELFDKGTGKSGPSGFFGDHFIIIQNQLNYSEKDNKVNVTVYDNHGNTRPMSFDLDTFMDMINRVLMVEKKTETPANDK